MYRVRNNEAPEYVSNLYTPAPSPYSNSRNCHVVCLGPQTLNNIACSRAENVEAIKKVWSPENIPFGAIHLSIVFVL